MSTTLLQNYLTTTRKIVNYSRKELIDSITQNRAPIKKNLSTIDMRRKYLDYVYQQAKTQIAQKPQPVEDDRLPTFTDEEIIDALNVLFPPEPIVISQKPGLLTARINSDLVSTNYFRTNIGIFPNTKYVWYVTDGDGRLQMVTPDKNTYEPKTARNHFRGVIARFYKPKHVYIQLYPANSEPQDFKLFAGTINCVLAAISRQCPKLSKKIAAYARTNNFIDNNRPATKADVDEFHKKFRVRIIVHSQTGIWYTSRPSDKAARKEVHIYAHDEHASIFVPIKPIRNCVILPANELTPQMNSLHMPKKLSLDISTQNESEFKYTIKGFRVGETIYKSYQPPGEDADNINYYHCTSELSYKYTKFINDNNLRPLKEPFYSIAKACDHHLTTQQFQQFESIYAYHNYDMVKAFPSFKHSKYYQKYQLFAGFVQLYENTDKQFIQKPGMSRVRNIHFNNEIVQKTAWIQEDNWYTHIRLNFILENNLATFDITHTVIAQCEDLEFPFKPFDSVPEHKRFNNAFVGRFIAGGHQGTSYAYYLTTSDSEMQQMQYELEQDPNTLSAVPRNGLLIHGFKSPMKSLFHIHAQIIDYQQVTFMEQMCKVPINQLVAFFTDAFFTTEPQQIECSGQPHGFKYEWGLIGGCSTYDPAVHEPIEIISAPPIEKHLNRLQSFNATVGPAGCGKTYISIEKHPRRSRSICAPNHKLKAGLSNFGPASTYHKFFGIGVFAHKQQIYEQIDLDEATQVSDEHMQIILETCRKNRMCLSIFGDFNEHGKIYQRPPPEPAGKPLTLATIRQFSVAREISDIRRQSADDARFLDALRELSFDEQLKIVKEHFPIVERTYVPDGEFVGISARHSTCHSLTTGIFANRKGIYINELEKQNLQYFPMHVPARCVRKNNVHYKGQHVHVSEDEVYFDRTTSAPIAHGKNYEVAYFCTADSIQGDSIDLPIYIDLANASMHNFLYTALTRCRRLSQIKLIRE